MGKIWGRLSTLKCLTHMESEEKLLFLGLPLVEIADDLEDLILKRCFTRII